MLGKHTISLLLFCLLFAFTTNAQIIGGPSGPGSDGSQCVIFMFLPDTVICKGDTITGRLLGNPGKGVFSATPANFADVSDSNSVKFFPQTTTTYTVVRTNEVGCYNSLIFRIHVVDSIQLKLKNDTTVCENRSVRLHAESGVNGTQYQWNPVQLLNNSQINDPVTLPLQQSQTFTITATFGRCRVVDSVRVLVEPLPIVNAGPDTTICKWNQTLLQASVTADQFNWVPGPYMNTPQQLQPVVSPPQTTSFYLRGKNISGCTEEIYDTVVVNVIDKPQAFAGADTSIIYTPTFHLKGSGGSFYQWSPATNLSDPFIANPVVTIPPATSQLKYTLRTGYAPDCYDEDEIVIRIFRESGIYIPNAFTPNGDGKNDRLVPYLPGIKHLHYFNIYNRWGQLVFSTSDMGAGWDGRINGVLQPTETFVYIIQVTDLNDHLITKKGMVTLIR